MIRSFADTDAEMLWDIGKSRGISANLRKSALKKLFILHRALELSELNAPPGNQLEPLRGDRKGQHSIPINDQYRICFLWSEGDAYDVEIVDYH